jgi:hypothetical protein
MCRDKEDLKDRAVALAGFASFLPSELTKFLLYLASRMVAIQFLYDNCAAEAIFCCPTENSHRLKS